MIRETGRFQHVILTSLCCTGWGMQGSTAMESIHMIKRLGGALTDSYLDEGTGHVVICATCMSDVGRDRRQLAQL